MMAASLEETLIVPLELLKDCEAGLRDVVVVYKIARLFRIIRDFTNLSTRFDKWNVSFCSVT